MNLIKSITDIFLKNWASEKKWHVIFLNYRHPYFYRDRYKLSNIVQKRKRDWEGIETSYPVSICSFLKHRALFETFLKTFWVCYFPFILKNIFAFYSFLSIIILQRIPCCPLLDINGVAVCSWWLLCWRSALFHSTAHFL